MGPFVVRFLACQRAPLIHGAQTLEGWELMARCKRQARKEASTGFIEQALLRDHREVAMSSTAKLQTVLKSR
jgi:hypothetical protein